MFCQLSSKLCQIGFCVFVVSFVTPTAVKAQGKKSANNPIVSLDERLDQLAKKILETTQDKPVTLGVFSPTGLQGTNFGPGLRGRLQTALVSIKRGCVSKEAQFVVKGDYAFAKNRDDRDLPRDIKITTRIIDSQFDEELVQIPIRINDPASIAQVLGVTGAPGPDAPTAKMESLQRESTGRLNGNTRISASPTSTVEIEILKGSRLDSMGPCPIEIPQTGSGSGSGRVQLQKNDIYAIRVHNKSRTEIAAIISIDGLNTFHFSDRSERDKSGKPLYSNYIVEAQSSSDIVGWFIRLKGTDNTRQFKVSGYADSAAGTLGIPESADTGVIHVQIARTVNTTSKSRGKGLGTALGNAVTVDQESLDRTVLPAHEFITIRYDRPAQ